MFDALQLKTRLLLSFAAVVFILLLVALLGGYELRQMKAQTDFVGGPVLEGVTFSRAAHVATLEIRREVLNHVIGDAATKDREEARMATSEADFRKAMADYEVGIFDETERQIFATAMQRFDAMQKLTPPIFEASRAADLDRVNALLGGEHKTVRDALYLDLEKLVDINLAAAAESKASSESTYSTAMWTLVALSAAGLLVAAVIGLLLTRSVTRRLGGDPSYVAQIVKQIAGGALNLDIRLAHPGNSLLRDMRDMQDQLRERRETEQRVATENLRVREALESSSVSIMVADADRTLVYANPSMLAMLEKQQGELRKLIPEFNAKQVIGQSFDRFHRSAEHQGDLLSRLQSAHRARFQAGNAHFALTAAPIRDAAGQLAGYVVEWTDRTGEVAVEQEIAGVVDRLASGDVSARIATEGKQEFFLRLAQSLNNAFGAVEGGIDAVMGLLSALAKGDLTQSIERDFGGKIGQMKDDANATVAQLAGIVSQISEAVETINGASKEIAQGNGDLSTRTESQAASLEETASSMEELTATVRQNAENARAAEKVSDEATQGARRGGEVVAQVIQTMSRITEASRRIGDIIGVIDGIAFQTNILALNAAVEAARAGEQGRGFAVVASEVRSLAQRSAEAAKEIKGLIETSTSTVDAGARLVDQAGNEIQSLVGSVSRVTEIMRDISAATSEQRAGIEQVNETVTHLDQSTQQNAAMVEQATAAARAMQDQAGALARTVGHFKLKEQGSHAQAQRATRRGAADDGVRSSSRRAPAAAASQRPRPIAVGHEDNWNEF